MPFLNILAKPTTAVGISTYASLTDSPSRPTYFGKSLAVMERSFSKTGDVRLVLGPQFPTSFPTIGLAEAHASKAGGTVAVMFQKGSGVNEVTGASAFSDAVTGKFVLHRVYTPEVVQSWLSTKLDMKRGAVADDANLRKVNPALVSLISNPAPE